MSLTGGFWCCHMPHTCRVTPSSRTIDQQLLHQFILFLSGASSDNNFPHLWLYGIRNVRIILAVQESPRPDKINTCCGHVLQATTGHHILCCFLLSNTLSGPQCASMPSGKVKEARCINALRPIAAPGKTAVPGCLSSSSCTSGVPVLC